MDSDTITVLQLASASMAGVFATLVAVFLFWSTTEDGQHGPTNTKFQRVWDLIERSRLKSMPEAIIEGLLRAKTALASVFLDRLNRPLKGDRILALTVWGAMALLPLGTWFFWGVLAAGAALLFALLAIAFLMASGMIEHEDLDFGRFRPSILLARIPTDSSSPWQYAAAALFSITTALSLLVWIALWFKVSIYLAFFASFAALPFSWFALTSSLSFILLLFSRETSDDFVNDMTMSLLAVNISLVVTLAALAIGHLAAPDARLPQTLQMLASNVVLDGATMIVTLRILVWAVGGRSLIRIPVAILVDMAIAGVLGSASLFLGLVFTEQALSIQEVVNVLVARAPGGNGFEFGPYFWAMHTTFLPTAAYLGLILLAWLGKLMLLAMGRFARSGAKHSDPLLLTSHLCAIPAAIFLAIAGVLQVVK